MRPGYRFIPESAVRRANFADELPFGAIRAQKTAEICRFYDDLFICGSPLEGGFGDGGRGGAGTAKSTRK
ncbi:hypothetical protein WBP07_14245 [Novosphingobium sp. BL-8A]|uniref:hypothetical protein n=1 Tax=Novosphingobium sp. BL-8A TaxID=3127639 RepID=UPI003757CD5F